MLNHRQSQSKAKEEADDLVSLNHVHNGVRPLIRDIVHRFSSVVWERWGSNIEIRFGITWFSTIFDFPFNLPRIEASSNYHAT